MSFDLPAYLERVRLAARVTPDAAGLHRLQRAHREAIPFENLDARLGRPVAIGSDAVFAKLVTAGRGGWCFEHNRLLGDALAALGFASRPALARVWLGADETPPFTHVVSLVEAEGRTWLADAGFGGSYVPPMPLEDGAEAEADGARFRLSRDGHGWILWRDGAAALTDGRDAGPGWRRQYSLADAPVFDADLLMGNHWCATGPGVRLATRTIVSLVLPRGFASLTDRQYRRRAGDDESAGRIDDPRVYRMRLGLMFGIALSGEEVAGLGLFGEASSAS